MSGCDCAIEIKHKEQSKVLIIVMGINAFMFFVEMSFGLFSQSTALIADSLDMLIDAMVYGVSLYAVGKPASVKIKSAQTSGLLQLALGLLVSVDVLRRLIWGSEPESLFMIGVGTSALVANLICLSLIAKFRDGEVHMRASWIFSKNDVIANLGIIIAGLVVYFFDSRLPDLIAGFAISALVITGGFQILKEARLEKKATAL